MNALNSLAGWFSLGVLLLGLLAAIAVPLVLHASHWLAAVIALSALVIAVLEGSYQAWAETDHCAQNAESARRKAEADLAAEQAIPKVEQTGIKATGDGGYVGDNQITFYNPPPGQT